MIIRIHGTFKTADVTMKPRKNEAQDRFLTRVYNEVSRQQRGLYNTVKIEVIETSTNILLDTFFGLIKKSN